MHRGTRISEGTSLEGLSNYALSEVAFAVPSCLDYYFMLLVSAT